MTEAKKACSYKSAITKNQLLHLLTVVGGTLVGMTITLPIDRSKRSLCDRGLVEDFNVSIGGWSDNEISFKLTSMGQRYLDFWTLPELLAEVKRYESINENTLQEWKSNSVLSGWKLPARGTMRILE